MFYTREILKLSNLALNSLVVLVDSTRQVKIWQFLWMQFEKWKWFFNTNARASVNSNNFLRSIKFQHPENLLKQSPSKFIALHNSSLHKTFSFRPRRTQFPTTINVHYSQRQNAKQFKRHNEYFILCIFCILFFSLIFHEQFSRTPFQVFHLQYPKNLPKLFLFLRRIQFPNDNK